MYYIVSILQGVSPMVALSMLYIVAWFSLYMAAKVKGLYGLYCYAAIATIIANIQVLRGYDIDFLSNKTVVLGNVVFSLIFSCNDIIVEKYGKSAAQDSVKICFLGNVMFCVLMLLTVGIQPILDIAQHPNLHEAHLAMQTLFIPIPSILMASALAYIVGLYLNIHLLCYLKTSLHKVVLGKYLWIRSGVSTIIGSLLDSALFSFLAWMVFASSPVSFHDLLYVYILPSWIINILLSFFNSNIVCLTVSMLNYSDNNEEPSV